MNLEIHQNSIRKLLPLEESKFLYSSTRWDKLDPALKSLIVDFENATISRQDVIDAFRFFYSGKLTWNVPFLLTMVWGFADNGYGTFRTNKYFASSSNERLIKDAFHAVQSDKLQLAYKHLKGIDGLNISYISKVLYFATRACDYEDYALIYDIRVARSLVKLTTIPEIFDIVEIQPSTKFSQYKAYNLLIHRFARELGLEADAIEMFLFNGNF